MSNLLHLSLLCDAFRGPRVNRGMKRRVEEVLDLPLGVSDLLTDRHDLKRARQTYNPSYDLPYLTRNLVGDYNRGLFRAPTLQIPAFGRESDLAGKFDLFQNSISKLAGPLEPNHLVFQFMGLVRSAYAEGTPHTTGDPLGAAIQMEVYGGGRDKVPMDDGRMFEVRELQLETRIAKQVHDTQEVMLSTPRVYPMVTLTGFNELARKIGALNEKLLNSFLHRFRHGSYTRMKEQFVSELGPESDLAVLLHITSPTMFFDCFMPRGIVSAGSPVLEGIVTLQTSGQLNIDVEDGDSHFEPGTIVSGAAMLYLIVKMESLVEGEYMFNYPAIHMHLTTKTSSQLVDDMLQTTKGRCHLTRDGKLSKTIIFPVGQLTAGCHIVEDDKRVDSRQSSQFEIILSTAKPTYVVYTKSYEAINH